MLVVIMQSVCQAMEKSDVSLDVLEHGCLSRLVNILLTSERYLSRLFVARVLAECRIPLVVNTLPQHVPVIHCCRLLVARLTYIRC